MRKPLGATVTILLLACSSESTTTPPPDAGKGGGGGAAGASSNSGGIGGTGGEQPLPEPDAGACLPNGGITCVIYDAGPGEDSCPKPPVECGFAFVCRVGIGPSGENACSLYYFDGGTK